MCLFQIKLYIIENNYNRNAKIDIRVKQSVRRLNLINYFKFLNYLLFLDGITIVANSAQITGYYGTGMFVIDNTLAYGVS